MSSGFELTEAIEVTVFRRSRGDGTWLGGGIASLVPEVLLDSHEKLMPNFLGGGAAEGVETVGFEAGGGPQGIDGRVPDKPCDRGGSFGGELAMILSVEAVGVESECIEVASFVPSNCTLSREEFDIRRVVCSGDFLGVFSSSGLLSSCLWTGVSSDDCVLGPRGVDGDDGGRFSVKERVDRDDCRDVGRSVLSCASSNVSYHVVSPSPFRAGGRNHLLTPSLSELSSLEDLGPLSAILTDSLS